MISHALVCLAPDPPPWSSSKQACGLVKNLALMTYITVGAASAPVTEFLEEWTTEPLQEVSPGLIPSSTKVRLPRRPAPGL